MKKSFLLMPIYFVLSLASVSAAISAEKGALEWSVWQSLPVFENGRMMPLDTFARKTVEAICGRSNPTLSLDGDQIDVGADSAEYSEAKKLFQDGAPKKFTACELLMSWLVEPEKWEHVPFLVADHKQLRQDVLNLPLFDGQGLRLRYVSLDQVENCPELGRRWAALQVRAGTEGDKFHPVGVDKSVKELIEAYVRYRALTYNPQASVDTPRRFFLRLSSAADAWRKLAQELQGTGDLDPEDKNNQSVNELNESLQRLVAETHSNRFLPQQIEAAASSFHSSAHRLADQYQKKNDKVLASLAADLIRESYEMHVALYDNGDQLRLVPALSAGALEENRTPDDDAQPWLGLQTLLFGSDSLMRAYPQAELQKVRRSFSQIAAAYVDRDDPQRAERFNTAMNGFTATLGDLALKVEPLRSQLPIIHRDENLLAATAYPPQGFSGLELFYNSLDPFFWSWLLSLIALGFFALALGIFRKPFFWLGIVALVAGQAITLCGLLLRMRITGLVPLTGMFDTTVYVATFVSVLGLWFALLPVTWPGIRLAWRCASLPQRLNYWALQKADAPPGPHVEPAWLGALQWLSIVIRAFITYGLFVNLVILPGQSYGGYFHLLPKMSLGESLPTAGSLMVWIVGWCVLLIGLYVIPRLIPTLVISLFTIPYVLSRQGWREPLGQILDRKVFALVGAAVCFLVALIAYFAPAEVMQKGLTSPRPILRDNFWLFVHVLTITSSYGAGALAWGLGNITLGYYLFGRYRDADLSSLSADDYQPAVPIPQQQRLSRRPPETCVKLVEYIYKTIQVAVVLLAAGTILGALWADVAWGRFWGWDAKEVWALVSLLVYMVILHGRYAGWSGNFGLAVGSVLGATAILMAWYGVNFFLGSGLHSYASGAGGQFEVATGVLINWTFVLAAAFRYNMETHAAQTTKTAVLR